MKNVGEQGEDRSRNPENTIEKDGPIFTLQVDCKPSPIINIAVANLRVLSVLTTPVCGCVPLASSQFMAPVIAFEWVSDSSPHVIGGKNPCKSAHITEPLTH